MSSSLPMFALVAVMVKYSPAYSTGREYFLKPKIICRHTYAAELYRARQEVA